jgi:hypothetical protein
VLKIPRSVSSDTKRPEPIREGRLGRLADEAHDTSRLADPMQFCGMFVRLPDASSECTAFLVAAALTSTVSWQEYSSSCSYLQFDGALTRWECASRRRTLTSVRCLCGRHSGTHAGGSPRSLSPGATRAHTVGAPPESSCQNALQSIVSTASSVADERQSRVLADAASRIEWIVPEVSNQALTNDTRLGRSHILGSSQTPFRS